ncbi:MAG: HEAT repeat domain-containing protein [Nitrospirae bacterium]|nr:HEAT repeat domain-containing protein [Nitrospirota bacterium]
MEINEDLKAAKEIVQSILRAKKIIRMYPANNPIYVKTIEDCFARFSDYFNYREDLVLKIRQNEISWESEQVYASVEKEENLALFFFKDGLREVTFKRGLSSGEMEDFLKIIAMDFERDIVDDDIVTLLWERDFQNIQYIADDAMLADEDTYQDRTLEEIEERSNDPDNIMKAYQDAFSEQDISSEASIAPLSDADLQQLMQMLDHEGSGKTEKLVDLLFELPYLSETRADFEELTVFFTSASEFVMQSGDLVIMNSILSRLSGLIGEPHIDDEIKKYFRRVISYAGGSTIIKLLGEILDSGQEIEDKVVEEYVRYLDKSAIPPLMNVLGELESIHARKIVIDALIFLGPKDITSLAKGLNDARWFVVRNIIYIFRKIADKRAVEFLLKTVRHTDIRVRKEVIRALGELGGGGVFQTLRECLEDQEPQIRSAALRALGTVASEAAKRIILDKISDKAFKDVDFDEKKEYFEVLSKWKDKDVFAFLVELLKKKPFLFGSAKMEEIRACSAYSLGLLGNKDAMPILTKFKGDASKLVREFSYTAIKRLEHGQ